ncbi:MAG: phosphotransferase [Acidimicrobiales bacterium]
MSPSAPCCGRRPWSAPPAAAIIELLDRLPAALMDAGPTRDLVQDAERLGGVIAAVLPGARHRVRRLLDAIARTAGDPGPAQPVHGDLYEAQLLVSGGRVTGLLDVDTAGAGHRIDDLANCCAHLSVLALVDAHHRRINAYGTDVLQAAEAVHPPLELRSRIAAALLGLATGPFRVQEPDWPQRTMARLALAERWLDSGRRPRRRR